ncbi:hypothetical protein PROFUN_07233 [Planoprotostelium fungivorum]|uniref:Bacteriocin-protection protein, YdeI/OmpD-associated family n=1 Tax=Planoprotostelium fungivorum TaxID=1890364 RepID=A0A2P6NM94_9EUKA|nr:hypothetical protein PROFUN_07233 [Planoprotostelium fungivorum]
MPSGSELPPVTLPDVSSWSKWLFAHSSTSKGIWLTLAKKGVTDPTSLTYSQALDEALCHGWIDAQRIKKDDSTFSQRFGPRAEGSLWSKRNVGIVQRLETEGKMQPSGWAAVERAKREGRWDAAYSGSSNAEPPSDLMEAITSEPKALETWEAMNKTSRYQMIHQLVILKTEAGKKKKIENLVRLLMRGDIPRLQKGNKDDKGGDK